MHWQSVISCRSNPAFLMVLSTATLRTGGQIAFIALDANDRHSPDCKGSDFQSVRLWSVPKFLNINPFLVRKHQEKTNLQNWRSIRIIPTIIHNYCLVGFVLIIFQTLGLCFDWCIKKQFCAINGDNWYDAVVAGCMILQLKRNNSITSYKVPAVNTPCVLSLFVNISECFMGK